MIQGIGHPFEIWSLPYLVETHLNFDTWTVDLCKHSALHILSGVPQPCLHSNLTTVRSMLGEAQELSLASWVIQLLVCKPHGRMLFSQDKRPEGEPKEPFWCNILSGRLSLCDCAHDQADRANVSQVITMENYLWAAPINKTKCFKLLEPKHLVLQYGLQTRAFEVLLWSFGPWNLITDDFKDALTWLPLLFDMIEN